MLSVEEEGIRGRGILTAAFIGSSTLYIGLLV
jgi:hypothetical protein